jgi:hypothetical protein
MKVFVCFIKQAWLLAIVSKFGGGTIAFYGWALLNNNTALQDNANFLVQNR